MGDLRATFLRSLLEIYSFDVFLGVEGVLGHRGFTIVLTFVFHARAKGKLAAARSYRGTFLGA